MFLEVLAIIKTFKFSKFINFLRAAAATNFLHSPSNQQWPSPAACM
jgi:hypothetical protein